RRECPAGLAPKRSRYERFANSKSPVADAVTDTAASIDSSTVLKRSCAADDERRRVHARVEARTVRPLHDHLSSGRRIAAGEHGFESHHVRGDVFRGPVGERWPATYEFMRRPSRHAAERAVDVANGTRHVE